MEGERKGELRKNKTHTVRVTCVGVVLRVYKPAAHLALLSPKKVKREEQTNVNTCSLLPITAKRTTSNQ